MGNLINWATPDSDYGFGKPFKGYADTGEGGLFAWAIVREPENEDWDSRSADGCHVDVYATLSFPDVQVSGPRLWSDDGTYGQSEPVLAAVFLGSTAFSLYSAERDGYYEVTEQDLTAEGKAVVAALSALGKVDIMTFLDT